MTTVVVASEVGGGGAGAQLGEQLAQPAFDGLLERLRQAAGLGEGDRVVAQALADEQAPEAQLTQRLGGERGEE